MGSSFHHWESDPLFSAAEVVQDSADRMEAIFRLLLHEHSLLHGEHSDPRLLTSIEYHRRDLATILETAKWQLEDFERAVSSSAMLDKSHNCDDVIFRRKQFITAIREQIMHVEKSLEDTSIGNLMRKSEWVQLNDHDRDGLASFLSGKNSIKHVHQHYHSDESSILKRFLDPPTASGSKDSEFMGRKSCEIEELIVNGVAHVNHDSDSVGDNNLRNLGTHYSEKRDLIAMNSFQAASCWRDTEDGSWDLEASEAKSKNIFHENISRGYSIRMKFLGLVNGLWTVCGNRVAGNYIKRLKDGEHGYSPSYRRYYFEFNQKSVKMISTAVFALIVLGILLFEVA